MTTIEITRFNSGKRGYTKADSSKLVVDTGERLQTIVEHIENAVVQLKVGHGEPRGLSFAEWKSRGCANTDANLVGVHALVLDYRADRFEELKDAADRLGYARLWVTTEDRAKTLNAITLIIPFEAPLTLAQYARIASCFVTELDVYGLLEGALAATHIVNVHATTLTAYERGQPLDGEAFIKRTAKLYQGMNARQFERNGPVPATVTAQAEQPSYTTHDGLFEFTLSPQEAQQRDAQAILTSLGVDLPK